MDTLSVSPLFLGLTRPPMLLGVTIDYLSVAFIVAMSIFILTGQFKALCLYLPLYCLGWVVCQIDSRLFAITAKKLSVGRSRNYRYWGCQSYEPM